MAKLSVEIGADASEFKAELAAAEAKLERLRKQKSVNLKLGVDNTVLNSKINEAKTSLKSLEKSVNSTGDAIGGNFQAKVANGSNTLTQFSRIAQDAPFGIMGIGNNITATAESFGYLSKSAGGAGNALKAIFASLTGVGGILLVVSLITTAFTVMSQKGITLSDVIDKITGNFNVLRKEMQGVAEQSAKTSGTEIANMKALVAVAQNENLTREKRLIAVKELQKEFPAYFGNLTQEQILNGNVTTAVKGLTIALIERAKASGFANKIGELAQEELNLNNKLLNTFTSITKTLKLTKKESGEFWQSLKDGSKDAGAILEPFKKRIGIFDTAEIFTQINSIRDLRVDLDKNKKVQNAYTKEIEKSTAAAALLKQEVVKPAKAVKTKIDTPQVSAIGGQITPAPLVPSLDLAQITSDFKNFKAITAGSFNEILALMIAFEEEANGLIKDSIGATFSQLGTAIGEALATGGNVFQAIGQTLIQGLASFLSEMGSLLIKYGTLAVVKGNLDLAILSGGPVAIGAGVAAIAVGVALKGIAGALGKTASGGGGASTDTGASSRSFTSTSAGYSGGSGYGSVVFEISGQSLIGVLSNTLDKNKRLGGSVAI